MHYYLRTGLTLSPSVFERLLKAIPAADIDRPLDPGRFSPREIMAHLADWEPIMRGRICQAIEAPGSTIEAYDEGQMAIDHGYASKDVCEQAALFRVERQKTVEYVSGLARTDFANTVTHPERGELTAGELTEMLLGHDMYHVEQLSAYLAERVVPTW